MKILPPRHAAAWATLTPVAWMLTAAATGELGLGLGSIFAALVVGAVQTAILRFAKVPQSTFWILATGAGAAAGGFAASRLAFAHPMLAIPVTALVVGACEGALQGLVLRSTSRAAPAWIFLAPISFLLAGVALVASGTLQTASFRPLEMGLFAAVTGVLQGLALALLPRRVIQ